MNDQPQFGGAGMASRAAFAMTHDGIPRRRHAGHLASRAGVSLSTARRVLSGRATGAMLGDTNLALADALDVAPGWLSTGRMSSLHPRTIRLDLLAKGFTADDAARVVRLLLADHAGHGRAASLLKLAKAGNLDLIEAARLY
jgi:hypothetical protein